MCVTVFIMLERCLLFFMIDSNNIKGKSQNCLLLIVYYLPIGYNIYLLTYFYLFILKDITYLQTLQILCSMYLYVFCIIFIINRHIIISYCTNIICIVLMYKHNIYGYNNFSGDITT